MVIEDKFHSQEPLFEILIKISKVVTDAQKVSTLTAELSFTIFINLLLININDRDVYNCFSMTSKPIQ